MKISRVWAMPNKETFKIKPIANLLTRYCFDGTGWADPFSGNALRMEFCNDLNPLTLAPTHLTAEEFLQRCPNVIGIVLDPPYSPRQVAECYRAFGRTVTSYDTSSSPLAFVKDLAAEKISPDGFAICCGWNSNGLGKKRGFELVEILMVAHGGGHNDTILTVERKINVKLNPPLPERDYWNYP
jgi:hypothetical protein